MVVVSYGENREGCFAHKSHPVNIFSKYDFTGTERLSLKNYAKKIKSALIYVLKSIALLRLTYH